jgi:asparagine synthase (glutamine-hydrolysing)
MPGIVGLITKKPKRQAERELQAMLAALRHETFYETGTFIAEAAGVYVGWAEREGTSSRPLPMSKSGDGRVVIFSGEDFSQDGKQGAHLTDAAESDPSFPANLNGRFHGVLVDEAQRLAKLFVDRFGIHRLYFYQAGDAFYFAAEAKAILKVRPDLREMDYQSFGEFVTCGCVLENRTLFKSIGVLPGGSLWTFEDGGLTKKSEYFDRHSWEEQEPLGPDAYYQLIRDTFTGSLPRYFGGNSKIAMSLTGGLDTRMVLAWYQPAPGSLPCYTFGGMINECWDVRIAKQVAQICQQSHRVIRVDEEFLSRFRHYAERTVYLSDGCADVSRSADLYVNEIARQIAPVRMTGNYGGEVLRGVRPFRPTLPSSDLYRPEVLSTARQAVETYRRLVDIHPLSFMLFRQVPWYHYGLIALEQTQLRLRSPFLDNDLVRAVYRAPRTADVGNRVCLQLIADGHVDLRKLPTDRGLGGTKGGVEASVCHFLLELQFKAEYAYDYGMPQWFAPIDRLFAGLHPERSFLGKHKFCHYRVWYRDYLGAYINEVLLDSKSLSRPHIQKKAVEAAVTGHVSGSRNYTTEIHRLLTLELIHRSLLDASSAVADEAITAEVNS